MYSKNYKMCMAVIGHRLTADYDDEMTSCKRRKQAEVEDTSTESI